MTHLDLGFWQVSYLSQVLTGADVRIGPSCKYPFQLQQLPNTKSGPLPPMGTQPTGTACGSGWESNQDSSLKALVSLCNPYSLLSSPFPIPPRYTSSTYLPFPHQVTWRCLHRTGHGADRVRSRRAMPQLCPTPDLGLRVLSRSEGWPRL